MTVKTLIPAVAKKVNRPFAEKFNETMGMIARNIMNHKTPAVAWSGGKDSTLVLWLCLKLKPDILAVFNNTGVEYPETVKFIHWLQDEWKVNLIETKPIKTFWECVKLWGMPEPKAQSHKSTSQCCNYCKDKPMHNAIKEYFIDAAFNGERAVENRNRMFTAAQRGMCFPLKGEGIQRVKPILWWTEDEVRQYHADMNIPLNPMYSRGCDRIGCMPCTAFKSWEKQLVRTNPKLYRLLKLRKDKQYCMDIGSPAPPPDSESKASGVRRGNGFFGSKPNGGKSLCL